MAVCEVKTVSTSAGQQQHDCVREHEPGGQLGVECEYDTQCQEYRRQVHRGWFLPYSFGKVMCSDSIESSHIPCKSLQGKREPVVSITLFHSKRLRHEGHFARGSTLADETQEPSGLFVGLGAFAGMAVLHG